MRRIIYVFSLMVVMLCLAGCGKEVSDNKNDLYTDSNTEDGIIENNPLEEMDIPEEETLPIDNSNVISNDEIKMDTIVLTVGDIKASYDEVLLYFRSYKQKVEGLYGPDIWDYILDDEGTTYAKMLKEMILEEIIYIKTICAQSENLDASLAEDERLDVNGFTADYMSNFTKGDLEYYGFTEEVVKKIYEENMLANKIYELLTLNIDTDVEDEEVRHAVFQYIFISKTTFDENKNKVEYTEDELEEVRLLAEEVYVRTKEEDFYELAKECSEDDDEIEFITKREDMILEFADEAFALKQGEVSQLLENETGYFIFYCKVEKEEDITEEAKIKLIVERQNKAFFENYDEWKRNTNVKLNETIWEQIDFNTI